MYKCNEILKIIYTPQIKVIETVLIETFVSDRT